MKLKWKGKGIKTKAYDSSGKCIIECDKRYYRPSEVDTLLGNSFKARKKLKWKPKISFEKLVEEMTMHDYKNLKRSYVSQKR